MDHGWTEVRYGRRRQRARPPQWDRAYGRSVGWTDRAPSIPRRRWETVPYPNRPVPPPRAPQYAGPRYRSYADVVRQGWPQPARRWFSPRDGGTEVRRQAADPQFGKLTRKLHAVIKTVHHLQNVALKPGKAEPRMIARMVEVLSDMIKPAAPTRRTADLIVGNAKNWGYNTYLILMEHYETCLEELLEELTGILTPDWKSAFEVAVRWARRNLTRITQDAIDHAEALVTAKQTDAGSTTQAQVPRQTRPRAQVQSQGTQAPVMKTAASTTPDQADQQIDQQSDWHLPPLEIQGSPRDSRGSQRGTRGRILTKDSLLQEESERPEECRVVEDHIHTPTHSELEALFDELQAEEEMEAAVSSPQTQRKVRAEVHRDPLPNMDEDEFVDSPDRFIQPEPQRYGVNRHPTTQKKLTDWRLQVHRKWLIIGDSNVSSLPEHFNKDVQMDSFPGAHFRHAQALMEKTAAPQDLVVEKIILSFGINGRENKCKETTVKNLQGAIRSAKRKFPYADVWVPMVNYSPVLPKDDLPGHVK
ncbi:hypothetical protein D5F01_LYC17063 [Larimichthys crocea]|uniref:Uncharacterized protein n=1 Tax=Larimichthys crocea TaxID=215358 RepID=A0A6G0HX27_LARCR|nr:hypothetical protein D5F01_LYC17063 [Larimichthys crocea]